MYEVLNSFLELPIGVRFTIFLAVVLILYWMFARVIFRLLSLVLRLVNKLLYALYRILEVPVSSLHSLVGGVFSSVDQGLTKIFGKLHQTLEKWADSLKKPKTIHGGKAFLVFLALGAYLIMPNVSELDSSVFTFWQNAYLEREKSIVTLIEGTTWFQESIPAMRDTPSDSGLDVTTDIGEPHEPPPPLLILEIPYSFKELRRSDSGELVTEIQLRLQELGFYDGPISGNYGPLTEGSVILFQETMGLYPNGVFDVAAWMILFARDLP